MKSGKKLLIIAIICLVVLLLMGYAFSPYIAVYRVNRHLNVSGAKLMMTYPEVVEILGQGSPIGGFGAQFYTYGDSAVTIGYSWDGLLQGKAEWIEIFDPGYSICGVKSGDPLDKAKATLEAQGFIQDKRDKSFFRRGSARISIYGGSVRVTIEDWTTKGRVY